MIFFQYIYSGTTKRNVFRRQTMHYGNNDNLQSLLSASISLVLISVGELEITALEYFTPR